jgi:hypothetical protein
MKIRHALWLLPALLLFANVALAQDKSPTPAKEGTLKPADLGEKLLPEKVFFRGQVATVQARNSAGVRFSDGMLVLTMLVDSSGYSSGLREKYQGYLINEVPVEIGGQTLKPGCYGFGFIEGNKFVIMDVGAHDVLQVASTKDTEIKRPVPLQILVGQSSGSYRLYKGRDYVEFHRGQ